MRKGLAKALEDDMRPEYDLAKLKGGVRGKYYQQARAGTNLVLIEADLARVFPDDESVNRALRFLLTAANAAAAPAPPRRARPTNGPKGAAKPSAAA